MVRWLIAIVLLVFGTGHAEIPHTANLKQICEMAAHGSSLVEGSFAGALADILAETAVVETDAVLVAAAQDLPYCFRHTKAGNMLVATLVGADQGAILRFDDGKWHAAPIDGLLEYPEILWQNADGQELWLAGHGTGTGGRGFLLLLRREGEGWQTVLKSEVYNHFQPRLLDSDHLLVTARNLGDEPLAWDANCCQPTNYQLLFQRQGESVMVAAERVAPDPYYAANVFFGALRYGQLEWLSKVATPEAIADATRLNLAAGGVQTNTPASGPEFGIAVQDELNYWPALPAALNGPVPSVEKLAVQVEIIEGGPVLQVELQRIDGKWLVSSVD